jgi:hypothetical protein
MSSVNDTNSQLINQLNQATSLIVLVLSSISVIPGGIGLIFSILIFTRAPLRSEPCTVYFFWSTCFSMIAVFVIQPMRVVAVSFNLDVANYNIGICKTQVFTLYVARSTASWLIVLACIDRFFHSSASVRIRRMSSLKTARMATGIASIVIFLVHTHMIVLYELYNGLDRFGNITPLCNPQKDIYAAFIPFWNITFYTFCPAFLMLVFGLLTLKNLRRHRLVTPVTTETNRITRRTDTQLLRMLAAQVLVFIICTLPVSIYQLYVYFTSYVVRDTLRIAQENVASRTLGMIPYFAHSSTFYLYTLTGTVFRKEFFKIISRCWHLNRTIFVLDQSNSHRMPAVQRNHQIITTHISPIRHNINVIRKINI